MKPCLLEANNVRCGGLERLNWLDGRNRAIVIAESLARVIAAIRITSVRWRSYLPPKTEFGPRGPCVRCAAIRIARLAFIDSFHADLRNGLRELTAFAEH